MALSGKAERIPLGTRRTNFKSRCDRLWRAQLVWKCSPKALHFVRGAHAMHRSSLKFAMQKERRNWPISGTLRGCTGMQMPPHRAVTGETVPVQVAWPLVGISNMSLCCIATQGLRYARATAIDVLCSGCVVFWPVIPRGLTIKLATRDFSSCQLLRLRQTSCAPYRPSPASSGSPRYQIW